MGTLETLLDAFAAAAIDAHACGGDFGTAEQRAAAETKIKDFIDRRCTAPMAPGLLAEGLARIEAYEKQRFDRVAAEQEVQNVERRKHGR